MIQEVREGWRWKPYRPVVQAARNAAYACIGFAGWGLRRLVKRGSRPIDWSAAREVVVVRPDRLGDAVLSTPALRALREALPQARITLIAAERLAGVLGALDTVDAVVGVAGDGARDILKGRKRLSAVKRRRPDVVVALEVNWCVTLLSAWLGGRTVGYDVNGMGWIFSCPVPYPYLQHKAHQVEVNLNLLRNSGLPAKEPAAYRLELPRNAEAEAAIAHKLREMGCADAPMILIHPGSRSAYTRWSAARFGEVADWIRRQGFGRVVIVRGPGEEKVVKAMQAAMREPAPVIGGLSLEELIALCRTAALFIGNSTGTLHVAAAVSLHAVCIIGGTHPHDCPERWGPWGEGHRVVHRDPVSVLGRDTWDWLGPEGLRHIASDDVCRVVGELLSRA